MEEMKGWGGEIEGPLPPYHTLKSGQKHINFNTTDGKVLNYIGKTKHWNRYDKSD